MPFIAGKSGKVVSGSTTINVENWSFTWTVEELECTTTGSGQAREFIAGLTEGEGEFESCWDTTNPIITSPPNIIPGKFVDLSLYIDATRRFRMTAYITEVETELEAEGTVSYTASFMMSGALVTTPG